MSARTESGREWQRSWIWPITAVAAVAAMAAAGAVLVDFDDPPDALLLIGRFHPVIVHFPIGLLLLAAILEGCSLFFRPFRLLRHATTFVLFVGAVGAVVSALAGFFLSLEGGYDEALVSLHMWLGISVAVGAVLATVLKIQAARRHSKPFYGAYAGVMLATVGVLVVAGHQGGSLTHGPDYLTYYLPVPVQNILGTGGGGRALEITDIDSVRVYQDLVRPIFEARCTDCHGASRSRGGLRLETPEDLMAGGDDGPIILSGYPDESELYRRITLHPDHDDAMPPDGARPLSVAETELIRWWIADGASFDQRVGDVEDIPSSVATVLSRIAPPTEERETGIQAFDVAPADPQTVEALKSRGYRIQAVGPGLPLLDVSAINVMKTFKGEDLRQLAPLAEQITWLDLGGTQVADSNLAVLSGMPHLTRLHLEHTAISDEALQHLSGLQHLEYLNLYGTGVSDEGLRHLEALENLEVLYLWQTQVTEGGVERLQEALPGLEVVLGSAPVQAGFQD